MIFRMIAILALATAGTTFSVSAQTNDQMNGTSNAGQVGVTGRGSDTGSLPEEWDAEIGDALFLDTGAGTLRPEQEFRDNWNRLSPEQQSAVHKHCENPQQATADDTDQQQPQVTQGPLIRLCSWIAE